MGLMAFLILQAQHVGNDGPTKRTGSVRKVSLETAGGIPAKVPPAVVLVDEVAGRRSSSCTSLSTSTHGVMVKSRWESPPRHLCP